jgi:energy-coupling factor transporter ATP-binding protein EcfA2
MYDPERVTTFALADSRNRNVEFGIKAKDRTRHVYVIGKTGMGKSTLLENMAAQDITNGEGMAFIDPHGKTAELLLNYVPEHRLKDVLYFAPFDLEHPISFNVLEDVGFDKRHLVVSGLMSTFKKIWLDAWSARMEYILSNTLMALLETPGTTLLGVNRMLADKEYRKKIVDNVKDPSVKSFWLDEFAKYTDKFAAEATPAIQNKIRQFTSNPLIRNIIGQPKSSFNLREMMDQNKIIIINLSKGRVGEANANLLGSMLITKIYLAAMSRADVQEKELQKLPNFYLYVDEFQSFANESFADILSEARKYKLNLTIAHQYIEQMSEEVRAAVFGNVGTMITFRVGAFDAEILEKEFAPQFTAEDLVNLGFAQIYLKLMIDGVSSMPFSASTMPPIKEPEISMKQQVIQMSQKQFAMDRTVVEQEVLDWHKDKGQVPKKETNGPDTKLSEKIMEKAAIENEAGRREQSILEAKEKPIEKKEIPLVRHFEQPKYVKRDEPRLVPPPISNPPDDDFVPLKDLKPKIESFNNQTNSVVGNGVNHNKKVPDQKSLAELRAVLLSLNKNKQPEKSENTVEEKNKPKEIPEDKLRKILDI